MRANSQIAIMAAAATALAGLAIPTPATAGESEWATAGKILAGVVGAVVLTDVLSPGCRETVVVPSHRPCPPRAVRHVERVGYVEVVRARPIACRRWAPGHYEWNERRAWEPGRWETEVRCERRGRRRVEIEERTWIPGRWITERERVWVPGHYVRD